MSDKSYLFDPDIYQYVMSHSVREPDILKRLRADTAPHPRAIMQIPAEQGKLFELFLRMLNARKVIEIGVFTGYSSTAMALALPPDGRIVACDISPEYTAMAQRYWKEAGVEHKIDFRLAPANETLQQLIDDGQEATFDFAFIDADKTGYAAYYENCLRLIRSGGLIALDNMLQQRKVIDPADNEIDTIAIREMNDRIANDNRVLALLLPLADGITLAVKR